MAGTVLGAAPLTVGVRARSTARGPTAPKTYSMASYSGLKANPLAMAREISSPRRRTARKRGR